MASDDEIYSPDPQSADRGLRARWWESFHLQDLFSCRAHSVDFSRLRADYLFQRIRLLSLLFALLAPFWIPIDYLTLDGERFAPVVALRLAFSVAFLAVASWRSERFDLGKAWIRLSLFLAIPSLFFLAAQLIVGDHASFGGALVGYSYLPFLLVGLLAAFPLTIVEGVSAALFVGCVLLGFSLYQGTLFAVATLADFWLLGLLVLIALWASFTQLHMLLRLYREATRDPLTGLVNRRLLSRWMDFKVTEARHTGEPVSVLLFDLDLFKRINDTHGHIVGDRVLKAFAELLKRELPPPALIGRYGGEEFLAILPETDLALACAIGERVRDSCRQLRVATAGPDVVSLTVSVGVAELAAGEAAEELLIRVDHGLYQAKESGRDMVVAAE